MQTDFIVTSSLNNELTKGGVLFESYINPNKIKINSDIIGAWLHILECVDKVIKLCKYR